jgi:hypothetical protein
MAEHEANVCDTLDEAAGGDIPPQFATIVGSRLDDEIATVWLLTNDRPPFEPEEVSSQRRNERGTGRWLRRIRYQNSRERPRRRASSRPVLAR